ncbi:MAG: hypothetical protein HOV81_08665 [Kofleriaceae bacterium]|nr:hypothetical protein [Kofleriaceae bacterium]
MARRSRGSLALGGAVVAAIGLMLWVRHERPASSPPSADASRAAAPVATLADAAIADATMQIAATYVGSAKCGECHEKELAAWQKSWHARALAPADRKNVVGNFNNAHFAGTSSEAWMKHRGGADVMRTRGADGQLAEFPVSWVIGGKRMQDAVTVMPDGRWQVLPVYFHVTKHEWVDYTEAKQGALAPDHPFYWTNVRRMANHECLDCHTTGMRVRYEAAGGTWSTTFVDANVACEDCHGPGSRHADTQEASDIVQPAHAGAVGLAACARCHGPRQPLFPLLDDERAFRVGESYDEAYDPIVITLATGTSSDFFADGRPSTSSFEYQAMLQSACFRKGGANCLTCHTAPHADHGTSELRAEPDALCKKCHAEIAPEHSHHTAAAAQHCVACHMPPVVSGVLDHFVDHAIDVPAPATTEKHGVPNACGVCHADKTPAALATAIRSWWPDASTRQARRERLADAFDEATARESAKPLVAVVADATEAPTLRGAASIVLGRRFGPRAAPAIEPLLASPELLLRAKACEALGAARAKTSAAAISERLADTSLRVRLACALALLDMGDPRGELALADLASKSPSDQLMIPHLELANAALRRGDLEAARKQLHDVVALAPYMVDALVQLAGVTADLGDLDEARRLALRALALEPHHRGAHDLKAKLDAAH